MKLLIDMNLSPLWVHVFVNQNWQALHWSQVGDPRASDKEIMAWARTHGYVVFTHDLDFGIILAHSRMNGPSVVQIRTQDVLPASIGSRLLQTLQQFELVLDQGALLTIDESKARVRILPINGQ